MPVPLALGVSLLEEPVTPLREETVDREFARPDENQDVSAPHGFRRGSYDFDGVALPQQRLHRCSLDRNDHGFVG
jgi:hypothetical protein